jgi:hypothetical protein
MLERDFQKKLVKKLESQYPEAIIFKNETKQGFPDLTILYEDRWALLECKRETDASHRPNQDYWVNRANKMSFASFIYPENEGEVLNALEQALRSDR